MQKCGIIDEENEAKMRLNIDVRFNDGIVAVTTKNRTLLFSHPPVGVCQTLSYIIQS